MKYMNNRKVSRIKDLQKGDVVRCFTRTGTSFLAKVDNVVTDMTHYRDVAYTSNMNGYSGTLTDNCEWLFVSGKLNQIIDGANEVDSEGIDNGVTSLGQEVSNKKQEQTNDVQQGKRFEHLSGNLKPNKDIINEPNHYTYGSIETIDYIEQVTAAYPVKIAFSIGNALKYISRAPFKNGVEYLKKAVWYLDRAIKKWDKELKE